MIGLIAGVTVALCGVMAVGWWVQRVAGNGGWTDVFWTFAIGAAGVTYALWPLGGESSGRAGMVAILFGLWALRLGLYLAHRVATEPEDARYGFFRRDWGARFQSRMFWFLQIQALAAALLAVSVLAAARNPAPWPGLTDLIGAAILVAAVAGEALADRQLSRFRHRVGGGRSICQDGLWAWSRHPNYFFEWLGWLAWPVIAWDAGLSWLALAAWFGPLFMYVLLVYVSGIPPTEARMLDSRGDAFRAYQARTSAFFPWLPKEN